MTHEILMAHMARKCAEYERWGLQVNYFTMQDNPNPARPGIEITFNVTKGKKENYESDTDR